MNTIEWMNEQDKKAIQINLNSKDETIRRIQSETPDVPYYGAIGGGFSTYYKIGSNEYFIQNNITKDKFESLSREPLKIPRELEFRVQDFITNNSGDCYYSIVFTSLGSIETLYNHDLTISECLTDFSDW